MRAQLELQSLTYIECTHKNIHSKGGEIYAQMQKVVGMFTPAAVGDWTEFWSNFRLW